MSWLYLRLRRVNKLSFLTADVGRLTRINADKSDFRGKI